MGEDDSERAEAFASVPGAFNAIINKDGQDWQAYATGYKLAADLIAQHVAEDPTEHDFLVYPGAFLYRHWLELRLKVICLRGRFFAGLPRVQLGNHDLRAAWKHAKETLLRLWPETEENKGQYQDIEELVGQFAAVDPGSLSFRFPVDKKGQAHLQQLPYMHLPHLASVVGRIAHLLDNAAEALESAHSQIGDDQPDFEGDGFDDGAGYESE